MNSKITLVVNSGIPLVDSRLVAAKFDKRHSDILRAIEGLKKECSLKFTERNFAFSEYRDSTGRRLPVVCMTRDGYSMLAMGFKGSEATRWKEKFIDAFNTMERRLTRKARMQANVIWRESREDGKIHRRQETDEIKTFIQYCFDRGSTKAQKYYIIISKMVNQTLFDIPPKIKPGNLRNLLSVEQLLTVAMADTLVAKVLRDGMEDGLHYKEIYQKAKNKIEIFGSLVGKDKVSLLVDEVCIGNLELLNAPPKTRGT